MIDWFRRLAGIAAADAGDAEAPVTGDRNAEIGGLHFMSAIDAHMKWKTRLEQYIDGRNSPSCSCNSTSGAATNLDRRP